MRQVLAVAVSFVAVSMVVFGLSIAPWFLLGVDGVMQPGRFVTVGTYDVYAVLVSVGGALFAGWLCAAIGRSRAAVLVLALVALVGGLANAVAQSRKPELSPRAATVTVPDAMMQRKEPAWFTLLVAFSGAIAIAIGGRRASAGPNASSVRLKQEYDTSTTIDASCEHVWRILTDAPGYETWNPEIIGVAGRFGEDERIRVRVKLGDGAVRSMTLRIAAFSPPSSMEWIGRMPLGLFVGKRALTVVPNGSGAEFRMHLSMTGPLAPFILKSVGDRQREIDSFAAALKRQAHALSTGATRR